MTPVVKYDPEANAAYIRLSQGDVEGSEEVTPGVVFDYDAEGRIVGMEIIEAREHLAPDLLKQVA